MTRDQRTADLALHGWAPIYSDQTHRAGLYHEGAGVGFVIGEAPEYVDWRGEYVRPTVKRIDKDRVLLIYTLCDWHAVSDWHLDQIEERLSQT